MKLASTVHTSSTQIPFKIDFNLLKYSSINCPKNVPFRFILRRSHSLFSGGSSCGRKYHHSRSALSKTVPFNFIRNERWSPIGQKYSTITCARRTEPEQEASTSRNNSAREASRFQPPDGSNDNERSCDDTYTAISGEATSSTADYASSLRTVGLCVFSAVAFGVGLGFKDGVGKASEFFAGYLLEQSLSVDNLFVFVLIFKYFKVPFNYQNRVLSYGIAGAVIFRLSLILLGTATLQRFEVVNLLLATILLYSSFKLFTEEDEDTDLSDNFIVKTCQKVIPVTSNYDGNRFITIQDGMWKESNILGRLHLCF
ncbi:hypothetical protein CDL12_12359 [Handroanthus impetiginosus]|uniref:Integral membrane protein TerC n=1 Tax=Handroanthus impetiginosus TaxID=429701 RepID=A0A2G9HBX0_9LAMI|nr:hypothetical protein CDL12_12359 [Handroanthus impetiginosus]